MKRAIVLPDLPAVSAFVNASNEMDQMVAVSKKGFNLIIDGSSIMGMLTLMGSKIDVECDEVSGRLGSILEAYKIA